MNSIQSGPVYLDWDLVFIRWLCMCTGISYPTSNSVQYMQSTPVEWYTSILIKYTNKIDTLHWNFIALRWSLHFSSCLPGTGPGTGYTSVPGTCKITRFAPVRRGVSSQAGETLAVECCICCKIPDVYSTGAVSFYFYFYCLFVYTRYSISLLRLQYRLHTADQCTAVLQLYYRHL